MYLHIGKDYIIEDKNIIGIFNIETIKKNKEYSEFLENIKNDLIDISNGEQKTLLLIKDKNKKGYITNISSTTLRKRNI